MPASNTAIGGLTTSRPPRIAGLKQSRVCSSTPSKRIQNLEGSDLTMDIESVVVQAVLDAVLNDSTRNNGSCVDLDVQVIIDSNNVDFPTMQDSV
ncbi:hypothetical protein V6N13_075499 [Hibiscus sabdariffa]